MVFVHKILLLSTIRKFVVHPFGYLLKEETPFSQLHKVGFAELNNDELLVFSCLYNGELTARSAKKAQYEVAKKVLKEDFKDGAIFIFYDSNGNFRFSFIRKNYGNKNAKYSSWKRFTYYVNPRKENKTFKRQIGNADYTSLDAIQNAFSVEEFSKEFYKKLSHWYFASFNEVEFPNDRNEHEYNLKANAMSRLITRLMFVWFMKQKGLVPHGLFDKEKINELLDYKDKKDSTYYKAILQNLFFATLNTPLDANRKWVTSSNYGVQNYYRYRRFIKDEAQFMEWMNQIPFLNGGLFENLDIIQTEDKANKIEKKDIRVDCFSDNPKNESRLKVPDYLFFGTRQADISGFFEDNKKTDVEIEGIIDILNRYDFTIDENTPDDLEVALDPELLGTVFENLLASYNPETQSTARKESGSFYTPRPIVDYMVQESLEYYLADAVTINRDKLHEISNPEAELAFSDAEKTKIVSAISEIKILDPACGSGAFPMGCLQHIVQILNRLDPENEKWKAAQVKKLKQDLIDTIDDSDYENLKQKIDQVFSNQYNDADYARKLYLIQNCLYGVDIQPIAMQISKLRFFISLLVEQKIDRDDNNFGIIPLPNLETKFVAASTLLKLDKQVSTKKGTVGSGMFQNLFIEEKETELAKVREKYFSARTPKTKRKWRAKDKELRQEIADLLTGDGWDNAAAHNIAQWDPFNQNTKADWFDPEWMFGVKAFDVVIGNPPYIQLQKALPGSETLKYADLYKHMGFETFVRSGDIYCLFYELGLNILNKEGVLCFITSNSWLKTKYGESLRNFFTKNSEPQVLLNFEDSRVFQSAVVEANILLVLKASFTNQLEVANIETDQIGISSIESLFAKNKLKLQNLDENEWVILPSNLMNIKNLIENNSQTIKELGYEIVSGIKTGFNKGFLLNRNDRDTLIQQDPNNKKIIHSILRGRDISKFKAVFDQCWIIYSHNGNRSIDKKAINIEDDFPTICNYLSEFKPKIKKRPSKGSHWTNIPASYQEQLFQDKIIWGELSDLPKFYFDSDNQRIEATTFLMIGNNLKYILGILNSKLSAWYFSTYTTTSGMGTNRWKKYKIEKFPIANCSSVEKSKIEKQVNEIIIRKDSDYETSTEEKILDMMIFKLYKLDFDQIFAIGPETLITKNEYENFTL